MTFEPVPAAEDAAPGPDPLAAEWADPAWQDAWFAQVAAEWDAADHPPEQPDGAEGAAAGGLPRSVACGAVHELIVDELSHTARAARAMAAAQYRLIGELVAQAAAAPDPWVGADPTLHPGHVDPRERTVGQVRAERRELAVRAAVLDAAVRLQLSETTVRTRARHAATLVARCPRLWGAFLDGDVPEHSATAAAQLAESLPRDDAGAWAAFDEGALDRARRLTPNTFRTSARALRERVHAESIEARHARAAADRRVWIEADLDAMATLTVRLPADRANAAWNRIDVTARHLHARTDDARTLAQLRADVAADLLAHGVTDDSADAERSGGTGSAATVAITVPALTLLGHDDEPATLEGYGPIDRDAAARLAGTASSWIRILTHPVTGSALTLDRTTYRVPVALRRWLGVKHPVCVAPGCARPARECDIDHRIE